MIQNTALAVAIFKCPSEVQCHPYPHWPGQRLCTPCHWQSLFDDLDQQIDFQTKLQREVELVEISQRLNHLTCSKLQEARHITMAIINYVMTLINFMRINSREKASLKLRENDKRDFSLLLNFLPLQNHQTENLWSGLMQMYDQKE